MKYLRVLFILAAFAAAAPLVSHAQQPATTAKDINLRAGPSRDYPVVAVLRAGESVTVEGCLSDYRWCDVVVGADRGWVYAKNVVYPYRGNNVPLLGYGAAIGIGILAFNLGSYWDDNYRTRSWYPQRQRWIDRPQPTFRPGGNRPPGAVGHAPAGRPGFSQNRIPHPPGPQAGRNPGAGRMPHVQAPRQSLQRPQGGGASRGQHPSQGHAAGGNRRP